MPDAALNLVMTFMGKVAGTRKKTSLAGIITPIPAPIWSAEMERRYACTELRRNNKNHIFSSISLNTCEGED